MTHTTNHPPSLLMGLPPHENWTRFMVDAAVSRWGSWIEGKLSERDEHGHTKWRMVDMFTDVQPTIAGAAPAYDETWPLFSDE